MSQIIAGLYEIEKQIGAGGGGIVYLGRHLRLEKQVVLKADKRRLSIGQDMLRREVDMLKDLSHTYIPQVYDFVEEDGTVYTVMDYIEGESLDKLLARGTRPDQPQIVKWACQLLEALSYLHGSPPHGILHGDIKPANIMLRPNGDICLIDYNIALALGEDGAVKVGFSRGYASPEHYGADYISQNRPATVKTVTGTKSGEDRTLTDPEDVTAVDGEATVTDTDATIADSTGARVGINTKESAGVKTSGKKKGILLDVRSDLYSLGATLYHMLSGQRPAQDAREVIPLGSEVCSPAVSEIIRKAMEPDPAMRYQSAEEMLADFLLLHKRDKRVLRHKRRMGTFAAVMSLVFVGGGSCAFVGLKQMEQRQQALALAEYSANALEKGDVPGAVEMALRAIPEGDSILEAPVTAQAQKALTDALGVYDLSEKFQAVSVISLPAAPFKVTTSPDGSRFAAVYAYETAIYDTETLELTGSLRMRESAMADAFFPDEDSVVYAGEQGVSLYDLNDKTVRWTGGPATSLALSGDGTRVAAVDRDGEKAVVYRVSDGEKLCECSFGGQSLHTVANDIFADPDQDIFALNEDGTLLAVSFANGEIMIYDLESPDGDLIVCEESDYDSFAGGFSGKYFAYTACAGSGSVFGLIDTQSKSLLGEAQSGSPYVLQADENGIYLANDNTLVKVDPETFAQTEQAYTESRNITGFSGYGDYTLVATDDNCFSFYDRGAHFMSFEQCGEHCDFVALAAQTAVVANRSEPSLRILRLEGHTDARLWNYDPRDLHDEARVSQDKKTMMLFNYEGFTIYDNMGRMTVRVTLPDAGEIYDQQFCRDGEGSYLEVTWYDGTRRRYSASDGSLLSETVGERPEKDLYEEFFTDQYRIVSSLHEAPQVYDLESGKLEAVLEEDSYLTYVTPLDDCLLTEYVNAEGGRFALLLDEDFETLAYLPDLCDVLDGMFIFDDGAGTLRQSPIYSLQDLVNMAQEMDG